HEVLVGGQGGRVGAVVSAVVAAPGVPPQPVGPGGAADRAGVRLGTAGAPVAGPAAGLAVPPPRAAGQGAVTYPSPERQRGAPLADARGSDKVLLSSSVSGSAGSARRPYPPWRRRYGAGCRSAVSGAAPWPAAPAPCCP